MLVRSIVHFLLAGLLGAGPGGAVASAAETQEPRAQPPEVSEAYPAVARFLAQRVPALARLTVTARQPLGRGDTLLLVQAGMPDSLRRGLGEGEYPGKALLTAYGAFVMRGGRLHLALGMEETVRGDAQRAWGADDMRVEGASPHAVTLGLYGDTYEVLDRKVTYLLDLGFPAVIARIVHRGLAVSAMALFGDSLYAAVSPDGKRSTIVAVARERARAAAEAAVAGHPAMATLDQMEGAPLPAVGAAVATAESLTFYGESLGLVRTAQRWSRRPLPQQVPAAPLPTGDSLVLDFLPNPLSPAEIATRLLLRAGDSGGEAAFLVTGAEVNKRGAKVQYAGVYELARGRHHLHALPVPDYARFARLRPQRVRDGYTEGFVDLEAGIGAFQLARDTVWFGTGFYDGEGTTGVGALGSFALATRRYEGRYLPGLADYSTSAIAVDGGLLWLGLVVYPEGASRGAGVLRYDRRTGAMRRYALPEVVTALVPWDGTVYAGTNDGLYRLKGERFVPLPLGFDPRGRVVPGGAR